MLKHLPCPSAVPNVRCWRGLKESVKSWRAAISDPMLLRQEKMRRVRIELTTLGL